MGLTSIAPQFLVDDLDRSIAFYRDILGLRFGAPWGGFYAIGVGGGFELHLKAAPKNPSERAHRRSCEHLDAYARVVGLDDLYAKCVADGVRILQPLSQKPWGPREFAILDPDDYILYFGEDLQSPDPKRQNGVLTDRR